MCATQEERQTQDCKRRGLMNKGEIERDRERLGKREMEGDCVSDKSWLIEISAGTGAQC